MVHSGHARRPQCHRTQHLRLAINHALARLGLCARNATESKLRPQMDAMESRVLLSGYTQTEVSYVGSNVGGANPISTLVADSSGDLFGTTSEGGEYGAGTVFEMAKGSSAITTLISFDGANGSDPCSGLTMDPAGNLYGTTYSGGAEINGGTVYEIANGTNSITTIASFDGTDGYNPYAGVTLDSAGDIFGTTEHGGTGSRVYGTVFEIASGSNTITDIATFNGTNGSDPKGGVALDSAGDIYGTTYGGEGTIFEIASGSDTVATLLTFNGSDGAAPAATPTIDTYGDVFGTTSGGSSSSGKSTVYVLTMGDPYVQTLALFSGLNGSDAVGALTLDSSGTLYGTTSFGGPSGDGTVFCIPKGSSLTDIASFKGTNGQSPEAGITLDASGDIFGTTYGGGASGAGTVFEIAKGSNQATSLASFQTYGMSLESSGVTRDSGGNLYGATAAGGLHLHGAVFEIPANSSSMTILTSFDGADGEAPYGGVILDQAGNLYGTTTAGGSAGGGTIFEIAEGSNSITTLASFVSGGLTTSTYQLTLDSSGDLYGTTTYGGTHNLGTVFELAKGANTISTLASFGNFLNDGNPWAGVTLDGEGDLFGTTTVGGFGDGGTVYEILKGSNTIKTIASFQSSSVIGETPEDPVVMDSAGNLYGTTSRGGAHNNGTVFEIPHGSSTITAIASFDATDGDDSRAGVTLDLAGNLYGTTYGGSTGPSTVFEIPHGSTTITRLVGFDWYNGMSADASLTLDPWGNLYGTTSVGGVSAEGQGTVFELSTNSAITVQASSGPNPSNATQPLTFTATVSGDAPDGETVTLVDASNNNAVVASGTLSSGSATLTVPAGTLLARTHNLIAVYGGDANFAASESAPYAQTVQVVVTNVQVNGNLPSLVGAQRSMVDSILYTFSEPVNISGVAATLAIHSGQTGTLATSLTWTAIDPNADGSSSQWAVSFSGNGVTGGSIANGVYDVNLNASDVTSDASPSVAVQPRPADTFYRLFGDVNGDGVVNAADNFQLRTALSIYNAAFDYNNDGAINAADNFQFKQSMSISFQGVDTTI